MAVDFEERGRIVWFSSEEEGGPDCGLSLDLGGGRSLYVGEMPTSTLEEHGFDLAQTGDGWWLVLYGAGRDDTTIIGRVLGETFHAQEMIEALSAALANPPTPETPDPETER